jgi:hypothetical protein
VSSLRSCGPLAYSDNERANQLLYALDDHVWGIKITALEEFTDFATLDTEKLFSKFKSHELSRKGRPNHDASLTSKAFITSARVGGHDANTTNTIVSSALEFTLSSLDAASDEQYESIPRRRDRPAGEKVPCLPQVPQGEEEITYGLFRVRRHHPLHRRLPQEEEARLQQVQLHQAERLQQGQ